MIRTMIRGAAVALLLLSAVTAQAEAPKKRAIPKELLPVLAAAEDALSADKPKAALGELAKWRGEPDAIHELLRGAAYQALGRQKDAEAAYRKSAGLDPDLRAAKVGLARALVAMESWDEAAKVLGALVDVDSASAPELGLYARVAFERGDLRLATVLVERGIVRFPNDFGFRRLDLALLLERRDWTTAREAARAMLIQKPTDGRVWRQLAAAVDRIEQDDLLRLATLEAAMLANPKDDALARRHVFAQLEAGHASVALAALAPQIEARPDDLELLELAAQVAEAAGAPGRARKWISRVPIEKRTEGMLLLEARIALDGGKDAEARELLRTLTERGQGSSQVYLWYGQLCERAGALVEAETAYAQAAGSNDPAGRTATLYFARLLWRGGQAQRAQDVLTRYTAEHPDDRAARALLDSVRPRRGPPTR